MNNSIEKSVPTFSNPYIANEVAMTQMTMIMMRPGTERIFSEYTVEKNFSTMDEYSESSTDSSESSEFVIGGRPMNIL